MKSRVLLLLTAFLLSSAATAADAMQLRNEVFQEVETTDAAGRKERKLVEAASVVPGTEVVYVTTYKNAGAQPAADVVITNPIPAHLEYRAGSAHGAGAIAAVSVDGGKTFGDLASLQVAGADGQPRPAQAADVTHVRWLLAAAVGPGAAGHVTYRARLK